jgi:hypothetical protein
MNKKKFTINYELIESKRTPYIVAKLEINDDSKKDSIYFKKIREKVPYSFIEEISYSNLTGSFPFIIKGVYKGENFEAIGSTIFENPIFEVDTKDQKAFYIRKDVFYVKKEGDSFSLKLNKYVKKSKSTNKNKETVNIDLELLVENEPLLYERAKIINRNSSNISEKNAYVEMSFYKNNLNDYELPIFIIFPDLKSLEILPQSSIVKIIKNSQYMSNNVLGRDYEFKNKEEILLQTEKEKKKYLIKEEGNVILTNYTKIEDFNDSKELPIVLQYTHLKQSSSLFKNEVSLTKSDLKKLNDFDEGFINLGNEGLLDRIVSFFRK